MTFSPDIEEAIAQFAKEQKVSRDEAIATILRDWLIGHGYLAHSTHD